MDNLLPLVQVLEQFSPLRLLRNVDLTISRSLYKMEEDHLDWPVSLLKTRITAINVAQTHSSILKPANASAALLDLLAAPTRFRDGKTNIPTAVVSASTEATQLADKTNISMIYPAGASVCQHSAALNSSKTLQVVNVDANLSLAQLAKVKATQNAHAWRRVARWWWNAAARRFGIWIAVHANARILWPRAPKTSCSMMWAVRVWACSRSRMVIDLGGLFGLYLIINVQNNWIS